MVTPEADSGQRSVLSIEFTDDGHSISMPLSDRGLTARSVFPRRDGFSVYDPTTARETLVYSHGFPGRFEVVTTIEHHQPRLLRSAAVSTTAVTRPATLEEVTLAIDQASEWFVKNVPQLSDLRFATAQDLMRDGKELVKELIAKQQRGINAAHALLDKLVPNR